VGMVALLWAVPAPKRKGISPGQPVALK
jgi:hypothetical protein